MYRTANIIAAALVALMVVGFLATFFLACGDTPCNKSMDASVERPWVRDGVMVASIDPQ
ncbi:MAG: hypothetical protein ACWA5T_01105 [Parvularcula sp.]